ncbi:MAG TPA: hypothetical protein VKK81_04095 [Candidatus Binatia bacterium]|nr:hypothetical protein [Candidatus Binatia bacterium]
MRREPLYAITDFGKLRGTYNLQIVTILVILSLKVLVGNTHFLPEAVAGGSLLIALLVDTDPWARKLSPTSVVKQVRSAVALLAHVIRDVWPIWIVAFVLGILFAKSRATVSIFGNVNTAGTVSFLALVTARTFFAIRYLILAVRKPWTDVVEAPLAIHGYNFSTRSRAMRHIVWTFFVGNVGIYALAESYVWMAGTVERIHDAAGDLLPHIDYKIYVGLWVLLAAGCFVWFRLLPRRQPIRATVPNPTVVLEIYLPL